MLGLACLAVAAAAGGLARIAPAVAGTPTGRLSAAGHAVVALVCFTLTDTSLLLWEGQTDALRRVLLVVLPVALLAGLLGRGRRAGAGVAGRGRRRWPAGWRTGGALLVLLAIQVALVIRFLVFVDGRLPLPGDHGSFLYRYHTLLHVLPRLRGYDPWWNAGTVDSSAALSGAASTLALFWPLLWFGPLERVYATVLPLVGAGLVPWCLFAATRLLGGSRLAALLAGLLALAPDETYFWWFMAHGTVPAVVSAALATLSLALAWRVSVRHDPRRWLALALAAGLTVGLFWALFAVMVGPALLLGAALFWRRLGRRDLRLALGIAAALLLVHGHWLAGLRGGLRVPYTAVGPVGAVPWRQFLSMGLDVILIDPNPLGLVLGAVGLCLLPRPLRLAWGAFVGSLLLTATILRPLFPWLELERFLVPLSFALIPPAAWLAARVLRAAAREAGPAAVALGLALLAVLGVHADGVWRQYSGQTRRGASQVEFEATETRRLVEWLRALPPDGARIILGAELPGTGRLGGGYPAFLQPLSGRPLMGYHQNFKVVDLHIWDLLGTGDLRETLELFNVQVRDPRRPAAGAGPPRRDARRDAARAAARRPRRLRGARPARVPDRRAGDRGLRLRLAPRPAGRARHRARDPQVPLGPGARERAARHDRAGGGATGRPVHPDASGRRAGDPHRVRRLLPLASRRVVGPLAERSPLAPGALGGDGRRRIG